ncbi:F-box/RNI-like superfamily protein [Tanacetum coccineum]
MLLRSGKKLSHKISCPSINEINEDRITRLPDDVLIKILGLLPESEANRTRILSYKWTEICAFLPNLRFVMPSCVSIQQANKFHSFVDKTLAIRGPEPIKRFSISYSEGCNYRRAYALLCTLVGQYKVQEIELMFPDDHRKRIKFCWPLFKTYKALVALTLKGKFVLDVPGYVLFPCLKKMDLFSIVYSCDKSFSNLITGCPELEELYVERLIGDDNLKIFKFSSPFLKRLCINSTRGATRVLVVDIDAPKMEYLDIIGDMNPRIFSIKPLGIIKAQVSITAFISYRLLMCLSSAKILAFTNETIRKTDIEDYDVFFVTDHDVELSIVSLLQNLTDTRVSNLPVFPNLVKLEIGMDSIWHQNWLLALLNNMPNLEHISLSEGLCSQYFYIIDWDPPVEAPDCLRFKIKEIIIDNETGTHEEFIFIKYLLKHSNNLEKITINADRFHPKRVEKILNFPRGSSLCQICLKGFYLSHMNNVSSPAMSVPINGGAGFPFLLDKFAVTFKKPHRHSVSNLPVFPNLVKFEIGMDSIWHTDWLLALLTNMPNLEHITLSERLRSHPIYLNYDWNPPVEAPDCLRLKMKEILINNETGTLK